MRQTIRLDTTTTGYYPFSRLMTSAASLPETKITGVSGFGAGLYSVHAAAIAPIERHFLGKNGDASLAVDVWPSKPHPKVPFGLRVRMLPYAIRDEELIGYLETHPRIFSLLKELPDVLRRFFTGAKLALSLIYEQEGTVDKHLHLDILTSLDVGEALRQLDRFDEQWWTQRFHDFIDDIVIDVRLC